MRIKIILTTIFLLTLFYPLNSSMGDVFLKKVEFELDQIRSNAYENEYFMTLNLNKGNTYKFKVTNIKIKHRGDAQVQVLDGSTLVGTNVMGEKYFDVFTFQCNKTGFYDILMNFQDGKTGHAVLDIFIAQ